MNDPRTPAAKKWGITYMPAKVEFGQRVWRCIYVDGPEEWGGRVSTFLDVLDHVGNRVVGLRVRWFNGGNSFKSTEPKTGEPFSVDFPMYAADNSYGIQIADGQPSDTVFGFGLGNRTPHHVFKAIFKLDRGGIPVEPKPPTEPPTGNVELTKALDEIQRWLDKAKELA